MFFSDETLIKNWKHIRLTGYVTWFNRFNMFLFLLEIILSMTENEYDT